MPEERDSRDEVLNCQRNKVLVDLSLDKVCDELFFISPAYVEFWMNNEDFKAKYHHLHDLGAKDGFSLFLRSAKQIMFDIKYDQVLNQGSYSDFDFRTANKSVRLMERRLACGFDNNTVNPRLYFLLNRMRAPRSSMKYWLMIPEFAKEIEKLIPTDRKIDQNTVYDIMKQVCNAKKKGRRRLNFAYAKPAIRAIEKQLNIPPEQRIRMVLNDSTSNTKDEVSE